MYESDAVLVCGGERLAVGTDAIYRFYAELLATGVKFEVGNQRPAILFGDLALTSTRLPNDSLETKTAFVTGPGSGIGQRSVPGLAEAGASVGCSDLATCVQLWRG